MNIFEILLYQPLFNLLILLYEYIPGRDFGVAVILLTVLIRLLLYPLMAESLRVQKVTAMIQPKMKEIQEEYKENKEKQAELIMQLWKENKINPLASIGFMFVQIPILLALYWVFRDGFSDGALSHLYGFMVNPGTINPMFLNWVDLSKAFPVFAVAAAVLQFVQAKMMVPKRTNDKKENSQAEQFTAAMQTQMVYLAPVITVVFFWGFPAALGLYWVVSSLFTIAQQYVILRNKQQ